MKKFLFILLVFMWVSSAQAAINPDTVALYFFEGDTTDETGNFDATEDGDLAYPTSPAPWQGTSWVQSDVPSRTTPTGHFTLPLGVVDTSNCTLEFAFETGFEVNNSQQIFEVGTTSFERAFSAYIFGGDLYLFNEGLVNSIAFAVVPFTRYYVKFTYDGSNTKVYGGTFTVPGTVTLTLALTAVAPDYGAAVNKIRFIESIGASANFIGKIDNIRWRNVTDFSTNVTTDPVAPTAYIKVPFFKRVTDFIKVENFIKVTP